MTRRSFLRRLGAAVLGLTLARTLPGIAPTPPAVPPPFEIVDRETGIRIRFISKWVVTEQRRIDRLDVFMVPPPNPAMTVRVS